MSKRKPYQAEDTPLELQMTPMIDVIFQLIIFFMCSIQFKSLEGKLFSYLPKDKGGVPTKQIIIDEVRVKLAYSPDSPLMAKVSIGDRIFTEWNSLYEHLRGMSRDLVMPDGEVVPVKIDADDMVPTQPVVDVLNICKKSGIQKTEWAAKTSKTRK